MAAKRNDTKPTNAPANTTAADEVEAEASVMQELFEFLPADAPSPLRWAVYGLGALVVGLGALAAVTATSRPSVTNEIPDGLKAVADAVAGATGGGEKPSKIDLTKIDLSALDIDEMNTGIKALKKARWEKMDNGQRALHIVWNSTPYVLTFGAGGLTGYYVAGGFSSGAGVAGDVVEFSAAV